MTEHEEIQHSASTADSRNGNEGSNHRKKKIKSQRIEALFESLEWEPVEPSLEEDAIIPEEEESLVFDSDVEDEDEDHRFPSTEEEVIAPEAVPENDNHRDGSEGMKDSGSHQVEEAPINPSEEQQVLIPAPELFKPSQPPKPSQAEEVTRETPTQPPFDSTPLETTPSFSFTSTGFQASLLDELQDLISSGIPLLDQSQEDAILPADHPLTPEGKRSLEKQSLVAKEANQTEPAILAHARPIGAQPHSATESDAAGAMPTLLLEILDQNPKRRWSEDEIQLVEQVTDQLTLALENARLFQESQERAQELETLNQITQAASQSLDLNEILENILDRVLYTFDFDAGLISIALPNSGELQLAVHRNLPQMMIERLTTIGLGDTPCEMVYKIGELVWIPSLDEIPGAYSQWEYVFEGPRSIGCNSYAGTPLESKGNFLGTICLFNFEPRARRQSRLSLLRSIGQQVGVVVENVRLFEQTQSALAETEALYQASAELQSVDNYYDILDTLRKHTIVGKGATFISIDLYDKPWNAKYTPEWVTAIARWGTLPPEVSSERYLLQTFFSSHQILSVKGVTIVEDVFSDERLDDNMRTLYGNLIQVKSLIFAPLVVSGQWIGHIAAYYRQAPNFAEEQIRHLGALAAQAAVAIQNIRLLDESRRMANQLQSAAEIARDASSTLARDTMLNRAVNLLRDRFGYYHASVFLVDESGRFAVVQESTGDAGAEMKRRAHRLEVGSQSVIGQVTRSGEPLVINDVSLESAKAIHRYNPLLPLTRAELGIPLKVGERVIGAVDVQSTRPNAFSEDDIAVLQILADQIAVAVDNARSYELAQKAMEEITEADRLKSQFLANMSHELRTPLNSIIGFSRVILKEIDGPINDMQRQDLNAIYNAGQHLLGLINDVLDLSKIEAGKMELAFEDNVDLGAMVKSVMSTVVGLVRDKPIKLEDDIADDLPRLRLDPMKIRQVLLNLMSNAAKFTEEGTIKIKANRQTSQAGDMVLVQVIDTGPGISPEDQAKLFQPFSQVDGSLTRKTGGSGLGLSISHHLVRLHGGQIGVESEPGKGSTFYFTLPVSPESAVQPSSGDALSQTDKSKVIRLQTGELRLKKDDEPDTGELKSHSFEEKSAEENSSEAESVQQYDEPQAAPAGTAIIMAIDQDPQVLDLYRRYLHGMTDPQGAALNFQIITLTDLDQAVTVAESLHPMAITLDVAMQASPHGHKDGWQVLEDLKSNPATKDIPVIVCTLNPEKDRGMALGADEYLLKPILQQDLQYAIQRLIQTRRTD